MVSRGISILVIVIALAALSLASYGAYTSIQRAAQPPIPKVTWKDSSGNIITSITLSFTAPSSTHQAVTFACSPSVGSVTLRLTPSLEGIVTLSQTDFSFCNSTPNTITISAQSSTAQAISGTLQVRQPDIYRTLAQPLAIIVQAT